jgi:hypothetical protein
VITAEGRRRAAFDGAHTERQIKKGTGPMKTLLLATACAVALAGCGQVAPPAQAQTPEAVGELVEEALYVWECVIGRRGHLGALAEPCQAIWQAAPEERRKYIVANMVRSGGPDRQFAILVYDCIHDYADNFAEVPLVWRVRTARRCLERAQYRWPRISRTPAP